MNFPRQSQPDGRSGDIDGRNHQRFPQREPDSAIQLTNSLSALRVRLNQRRRERLFGRPSGLSPQWERPR
jgi:hypothetical protein